MISKRNKVRLVGVMLIGIALMLMQIKIGNADIRGFISGLLTGAGIGWIITGHYGFKTSVKTAKSERENPTS